jgi:hypothetical protein
MSNMRLPKVLQTTKFGTLELKEIILPSLPDFYAFYYHSVDPHPQDGAFQVVFHPPNDNGNGWSESLANAELRAGKLLAAQQDILQTGDKHFKQLFKKYGIDTQRIRDVFPDLKLHVLKLNATENDELVYAPCRWFRNLDLFVSVDRDLRVTKAHFDG